MPPKPPTTKDLAADIKKLRRELEGMPNVLREAVIAINEQTRKDLNAELNSIWARIHSLEERLDDFRFGEIEVSFPAKVTQIERK